MFLYSELYNLEYNFFIKLYKMNKGAYEKIKKMKRINQYFYFPIEVEV